MYINEIDNEKYKQILRLLKNFTNFTNYYNYGFIAKK